MTPWKGTGVLSAGSDQDAHDARTRSNATPAKAGNDECTCSMPKITSQVELAEPSAHGRERRSFHAHRPDVLHTDGHAQADVWDHGTRGPRSSDSLHNHGRMLNHGTLFRDRIFDDEDWSAYASYKRYILEPGKLCAFPVHHQCLVTAHSLCFNEMSSTSHRLITDTRCAHMCNRLQPMFRLPDGVCLAFSTRSVSLCLCLQARHVHNIHPLHAGSRS